ncbi:MAG TPA: hypothetical protein VHE35_03650 [Kofleriaceae bacterium]|nr:hypothetical protein [Kofleriaceae bacterium]
MTLLPRTSALAALALVLAGAAAGVLPRAAAAEPRHHDGLYLRLGLGGGFALATLSTTEDSTSKGANVATELAVGKNVRPGLVVGVGTFPMIVPAPSYDGVDAGGQHISGTGPFVDWYRRPRGGLHLQAGVLFAAGYLGGSDDRDGKVGVGYGMMAGAGFDRYVAPRWSLGALARVTAYRLYGVDDKIRLVSPSLLFTATYD